MAMVELLCRYSKESTDEISKEIKNELQIQEVIQGDKFDLETEKAKLVKERNAYEYGPMVFNLKDVCSANHVDKKHTYVEFYMKPGRTFKISYEQFKIMYATLVGVMINDFTAVPEVKNQRVNG